MKTLGEKIRYFRESKNLSQSGLARLSDLSNDYMNKIELDKVANVGLQKIESIATALGVSILDLIDSKVADSRYHRPPNAIDAPDYTPFDIPVVGLAKAGKGGFFGDDGLPISGQASRMIHRPDDVKDQYAYAVQVDGDSMEPFIRKGHFLLCETDKEPKNGDYVVVHLHDGQVMVKEYKHDGVAIVLKSINPLHDPIVLAPQDVRAIHVVHWIKRN